MRRRRLLRSWSVAVLLCGCAEEQPTALPLMSSAGALEKDIEGEVLVRITRNGLELAGADPGLYVYLHPLGIPDVPGARQWYDPSLSYGAQWFDPQAQNGPCRPDPVTGLPGLEVHRPGPGAVSSGLEVHCARPGSYTFSVRGNTGELTSFTVEYAQAVQTDLGQQLSVWNSSAQIEEVIAAPTYVPQSGELGVIDLGIHIDLQPGALHQDTAILLIENAGSDYRKPVFINEISPSGTEQDYFRFSAAGSSTTWVSESKQALLSRFWWDTRFDASTSGYYDLHPKESPNHMLVVHRYGDDQDRSGGQVEIGIDLKRPDELPATGPQLSRVLALSRTDTVPVPTGLTTCMAVEATATGVSTDQYLVVGPATCAARGQEVQYRWYSNGTWTASSSDTLYDFLGFANPGNNILILEARDAAGNVARDTMLISTSSTGLWIDGPAYITEKLRYQYRARNLFGDAPIVASWLERYNPQLWWYDKYLQDSVVTRIWAMGDYSTELRAQNYTAGGLRRGRLHVEVCSSGCMPDLVSKSSLTEDIFGAGPVILTGSGAGEEIVPLYDLAGDYVPGTPFVGTEWLRNSGAVAVAGYDIRWTTSASRLEGVERHSLRITPEGTQSYSFGLAIDPDLGGSPSDDQVRLDVSPGILYLQDPDTAMALLLLDADLQPVRTLHQFGSIRPAPAARRGLIRSLTAKPQPFYGIPDDAQFVFQAEKRSGESMWTLVIIRARSLSEVQLRANAFLSSARR